MTRFPPRTAALSLIAATLLCAAAHAQSGHTETGHTDAAPVSSDPVSVTVSYADLDIDRPLGAKALLRRIEAAATRACGFAPDQRLLADAARFAQCRKTAIETAVARVDSPTLTAMSGQDVQLTRMAGR